MALGGFAFEAMAAFRAEVAIILKAAESSFVHLESFSHTMKPLGCSLPRSSCPPNVMRIADPFTTPVAGLHGCTRLKARTVLSDDPAITTVFSAPHDCV